ncbi:MAG: hypothetical protein M3Q52_09475 [Pseudomonadota bacterium]|nr:hypothetical protein [Pseudomonadota bacterium]
MRKTVATLVAAAVAGVGLAALPAPAIAQSNRIAEVIVYGNDACPRSTDDEVVVCARKPEADRYRIPEQYRSSGTRQERQSWASRATQFETVGATGINSCSAVGPGGHTGCLQNIIDQARDERREQIEGNTPPE